jgi:hypothetical protein
VDYLVVGALQKGRVYCGKGFEALRRETRRESDGMLFGDADVESPPRKRLAENVYPGAARHCRCDRNDAFVFLGFLNQALAKHFGVSRRRGHHFELLARTNVEFDDAVVFILRRFRRRVAFALLRTDVHQNRADLGVAHILQYRNKLLEIVAIDYADVIKSEFFEQGPAGDKATCEFFRARGLFAEKARQPVGQLLSDVAQRHVHRTRQKAREIMRHRPDRRSNRHFVIVENNDKRRIHRTRIVHGFIGHARRDRTIANYADNVVIFARQIACDRHAQTGGNRRRGMRRAESVVFTFRAFRETGKTAAGAQRPDTIAAASQNFVRIGLMADIPDQFVFRGVEHIMQRDRQLHHAEAGAEMAAGNRDRGYRFSSQLVGNLLQVLRVELTQIERRCDGIEECPVWFRFFRFRIFSGHGHAFDTN